MRSRNYIIYVLMCPVDGCVKYVGRTCTTLRRRLTSHVSTSLRGKAKSTAGREKEDWIRKLAGAGLTPEIEAVDFVERGDFLVKEKYWIDKIKEDTTLLNAVSGGAGGIDGPKKICINSDIMDIIGVLSDSDVAKVACCSRKAISYHRECLGVSASYNMKNNTRPPISKSKVAGDLLSNQLFLDRLGKESDLCVAKAFGCSKKTVIRIRKRLGIQSASSAGLISSGKFGDNKKKQFSLDEHDSRLKDVLGEMTDEKAAEVLGVKHGVANRMRKKLGISSYRCNKKKDEL